MRGTARPGSRRRRRWAAWPRHAAASLLGVAVGACIIEDNECGTHQTRIPGTYSCECEPGFVPSTRGYGCDPCGEHEESSGGKCICASGYTRVSDTAPCEPIVGSALGESCSSGAPCVGEYAYCATSEAAPYCTRTCAKAEDCPASWRCVASGAQSFCKTPPTGLGEECTSAADCAGKEASYCSSSARACLVNNCVQRPSECPSGSVCCDLTAIVGQSLCLASSAITNGTCPLSGQPPVTQ